MPKHSTNPIVATAFSAAILAASTSGMFPQEQYSSADELSLQNVGVNSNSGSSGAPIMFYNHASNEVSSSTKWEKPINISDIKSQIRYKQIENSFNKNSEDFPKEKVGYLQYLANNASRLSFIDNVSSYNDDDESIDTILKLENGLKLSISQFIDDDIDDPVVFSIHRNGILLVSDELPLDEIVDTINSLKGKYAGTTEA